MKTTSRLVLLSGLGVGILLAPTAPGAVLIVAQQSGSDVVVSGSGTINTTSLDGPISGASFQPRVRGSNPTIVVGETAGVELFGNVTAPGAFGPPVTTFALGVGDLFGAASTFIAVPEGYVSEAPLSGSALFPDVSIATLGLVPGVYVWEWGEGLSSDSLTLVIVPEPSPIAIVGIGLLILAFHRKRQDAQVQERSATE